MLHLRLDQRQHCLQDVHGLEPRHRARDAVLLRHFSWELSKLFRPEFADLPRPRQERLASGVAALADRFWTPQIRLGMPVHDRVAIARAQSGALDELVEAVRERERGTVEVRVEGDRALLAYPGFRDPRWPLDDSVFDLGDGNAATLVGRAPSLESRAIDTGVARGGTLRITVRTGLTCTTESVVVLAAVQEPFPSSADTVGARRLPEGATLGGMRAVLFTSDHNGTLVQGALALEDLVRAGGESRQSWSLRLYVDIAGRTYEIPVPSQALRQEKVVRSGLSRYSVVLAPNPKGRLTIRVERLPRPTLRGAARRLLRPLRGR
jgi:hypothetical protein